MEPSSFTHLALRREEPRTRREVAATGRESGGEILNGAIGASH